MVKHARLRTVVNGLVCEEDAIMATTDEWADLIVEDPSFAAWRTATHADGTLLALEPLSDVLSRVLPDLAASLLVPDRSGKRRLA